jgi:hypothetical protein
MTTRSKVMYGAANAGCSISAGKTASALIVTGSGIFLGLLIKCDGTNDLTLNVFDAVSAAGTQLIPTDLVFDGTVKANSLGLLPGIRFVTGLYLEIAVAGGGSCEVQVLYDTDDIKGTA